jgi:hypothetical protein
MEIIKDPTCVEGLLPALACVAALSTQESAAHRRTDPAYIWDAELHHYEDKILHKDLDGLLLLYVVRPGT